MSRQQSSLRVETLAAPAYTTPTASPESDGTLSWDSTTLVLVTARAAGEQGIGWTYAGPAAAQVVSGKLADVVEGRDASAPAASWAAMQHAVRNLGRPGLVAEGISAVDVALWALPARLAGLPVCLALGAAHDGTPVYGSGGFTSYDDQQLAEQLSGWVGAGIARGKMKGGRDPAADPHRLEVARKAIGDDVELFVDANGAYTRKQALEQAELFAGFGTRWLAAPVRSDDLPGRTLGRAR